MATLQNKYILAKLLSSKFQLEIWLAESYDSGSNILSKNFCGVGEGGGHSGLGVRWGNITLFQFLSLS